MTRIMLVDDHASFLRPLAYVLGRERDLEIVAQAQSVAEARRQFAGGVVVDVALFDLNLPDGSGLELIPDLRRTNPTAAAVILTGAIDGRARAFAVEAGASAIFHKSAEIEQIVDGIRRLHAGETLISPAVFAALLREAAWLRECDRAAWVALEHLTRREREVLQAIADGLSDKQIADRLYLSPKTIRNHVVAVLDKLGVDSRLQALVLAVRHGIVAISGNSIHHPLFSSDIVAAGGQGPLGADRAA